MLNMLKSVLQGSKSQLITLTRNSAPSSVERIFASKSHISAVPLSQFAPASRTFPVSKDGAEAVVASLKITESCKQRLRQILDEKGSFLRVSVEGGGCSGFQYKFAIDNQLESDDIIVHDDGPLEGSRHVGVSGVAAKVVIDPVSLELVKGSTLDYETELIRSSFRITENPKAGQGCSCGASFNINVQI